MAHYLLLEPSMWTVAGKSLISILLLALVDIAFSASRPSLNPLDRQYKCVPVFLQLFDDLDRNDLELDPIFQQRFDMAKTSVMDPFCSTKLSSPPIAAAFMRFIWRELPEAVCMHRSQKTALTGPQAEAACKTAPTHDLVVLENANYNVLILGETHKKDYIAATHATNLLNFFPLRGIEGFSGNIEIGTGAGVVKALLKALTKVGILSDSTTYKSLETGYYFGFDGQKDFLMVNQVKSPHLDSGRTNPFHFLQKLQAPLEYPVTINLERSQLIKERIEKECKVLNSCSERQRTHLLIYLRNSDMASNIAKILATLAKNQDLLVIVGARHVADLANRITCQNKMTGRVLSDSHQDYPMTYNLNACQRIVKI